MTSSDRMTARASSERFALARPFRISRGTKTHAEVVTVTITTAAGERFLGEGVPYTRYGESIAATLDALAPAEACASLDALEALASTLSGAGANALTSAIFAATSRPGDALADFHLDACAATVGVAEPDEMAAAARATTGAWMKAKLMGDGRDLARLEAMHAARPDAPIWIDANEGLDPAGFAALAPHLASVGVVLVEQPLRAGEEIASAIRSCPIPVCADESYHDARDVARVVDLGYRAVNVKLDKAGGVVRACDAARAANAAGLSVVFGCMVCSSLSIAAGWTAVKRLRAEGIPVPFVDLDGAAFLAADRPLGETGWGG